MDTRSKARNKEVHARPTYLAPLYFPGPVRRGIAIGETALALVLKYLTSGTKISNRPGPTLFFLTLFAAALFLAILVLKKQTLLSFIAALSKSDKIW